MRTKPIFTISAISLITLVVAACAPAATPTVEQVQVTVEVPVEATRVVTAVAPAPVPSGPYEHLARARAGEFAGTKVTIFGVYTGEDANRFSAALVPFEQATGNVHTQSSAM